MRYATVSFIAVVAAAISAPVFADQYVNGYFRSDGTYVPPHYQTSPNSTKIDNYSTKGNVNPYTGQSGYKNPYQIDTPKVQPYRYEPYKAPTYEPYTYKPYKY